MIITVNSIMFASDSQGNIETHVELDTEYTHQAYPLYPNVKYCKNITAQCREIHQDVGVIFAHPDIASEARHPVFKHDFVVWDYLLDLGVDLKVVSNDSKVDFESIPLFIVNIYAYFALAEIGRVFQGKYLDDIVELLKYPRKGSGLKQTRRLIAFTQSGRKYHEYIETNWFISINDVVYKVALSVHDTGAIIGKSSYQDFCTNAGLKLQYKDNFSSREKEGMLDMYHERPHDFNNYALGDLYNFEALNLFSEKFKTIYDSLDLSEFYTMPRYTIGSTVSKLFESSLHSLFGSDCKRSDIINKFCQFGSADRLKRENSTACLLAKVDGGRCRNNRPLDTVHHGVLCDIDISGCYGEGLRTQIYPLGVPCILEYPRGVNGNKFLTLRNFLKKYSHDFVSGLWHARVSLKDGYCLKYQQDFLMSWFPPNDISKMITDSEMESTDQWWEIDNVGLIKIFKNDIQNAVINHDFIQWLENIATPRQRKELLDNLLVYSAGWYPKSLRVDSIEELEDAHNNYKPKNTTEIKLKGKKRPKVSIQDMCHVWYGENIGTLLVDKLLIERKKYPKKTPLNNLFKLCINTIYGDMVSPFFKVGNVIVGNNITARARALAWYMEKGFNGWQTITDGCTFDLTKVPIANDSVRLNGENTITLYADKSKGDIKYKNLGLEAYNHYNNSNDSDVLNDVLISQFYDDNSGKYDSKEPSFSQVLSDLAWNHLAMTFQGVDVLHKISSDVYGNTRIGQFSFEVKGLFVRGTFHGSANYSLTYDDDKIAMRSYSKKPKSLVVLGDDLKYLDGLHLPAKDFLLSLVNPYSVPRSKVFIDEKILKINDYRNHHETYFNSRVIPGYTVYQPRVLREFSLSQFTFNTYKQYKSWKSEYERLIRKYSQSYEMFFTNKDGTIDFQKMIETVELAIRNGEMKLTNIKGRASRNTHRYYRNHDEHECLERTKNAVKRLYQRNDDL